MGHSVFLGNSYSSNMPSEMRLCRICSRCSICSSINTTDSSPSTTRKRNCSRESSECNLHRMVDRCRKVAYLRFSTALTKKITPVDAHGEQWHRQRSRGEREWLEDERVACPLGERPHSRHLCLESDWHRDTVS